MMLLKFKCPIIEFNLLIVAAWVSICNAARGMRTRISRAVARANHGLSVNGFNGYKRHITV